MSFAGVDVGAATAKAVILKGDDLSQHFFVMPTGHDVRVAAEEVLGRALAKAGLAGKTPDCVFSTGYGRNAVSFARKAVSEIICHAKGAFALDSATRAIIDIGGQDSKVIQVNDTGRVVNFAMNDKCAAGTGRFLEVMAGVLNMTLEELGPKSLLGRKPCQITSTCTVFAETEVVSLRAQGSTREDIVAGIHRAVAFRVGMMAKSMNLQREVMFTGGVAKNIGVKKAIENDLGLELCVPDEPQIIGALGAALLARETCLND
jgi:predicted CoA-substrate-specific enzyme activase